MREGYHKRRNGGYVIDFVIGGIRVTKKTKINNVKDIKALVKAEKDRVRNAIARGEVYVPDAPGDRPLTIGVAVARFLEESEPHRKDGSNRWVRQHLEEMVAILGADRLLEGITTADMLRVRTAKAKQLRVKDRPEFGLCGPATVNRSWMVPRSLFRWAERKWGIRTKAVIHWTDLKLREPKERVRVLSDKEAHALRYAMEDSNEDYVAIWLFLLLTGVRKSEAINLKWSEVDFQRMVFKTVGKGDSNVYKMITPNVEHILRSRVGGDPVRVFTFSAEGFCYPVGTRHPFTEGGLRKWWTRVRKIAAEHAPSLLEKGNAFRMHDARHCYATNLLQKTGNLKLVQTELGHSRIETTARYAHILEGDRRQYGAEAEAALLNQTKFDRLRIEGPSIIPAEGEKEEANV